MILRILPLALLLTATAAGAAAGNDEAKPLKPAAQESLRCAAAFATVANAQARGDREALAYPPLDQRGREFFTRVSAKLMDDTGMNRGEVAARLKSEAEKLYSAHSAYQLMPGCMVLLDASGL